MTLLDSTPPKPPRHVGRYVLLVLLFVIFANGAAYYVWDYPEEHAVSRFLVALEHGDYKTAYQLWQPSSSYTFQNFMSDWGPSGDYGKIHEFEILQSKTAASQTVVVVVLINNISPPLKLLVDKKTKGLAYSPY